MTFDEQVDDAVARDRAMVGASAAKRGRNPRWPYVPVLVYLPTPDAPRGYTTQIRGLAFATRPEAVAAAEAHLDRASASLRRDLLLPNHRALREHHGLPRELPAAS